MAKIDFKKDWFNRKKENAYSFYDDSKRLFDWDSNRASGYASYFVKDNENLKSAAKMVSSMFSVIGVPKKTKYEHTANIHKRGPAPVHIPLSMLRNEEGEYLNKDTKLLDAFYGASIQNAALATMQTQSEFTRTMQARNTKQGKQPSIKDLLFTILNTERIDKRLADRYPGYSKFVQKFKQYKYDDTYEPLAAHEHAGKRLLETIAKFLRYPEHVTEEEIEEFAKPLSQIEAYMKKHGFPVTSDQCETQSTYLTGVVNKFVKAQDEEPPGGGGDEEKDEESEDEDDGGGKGKAPKLSKEEMGDFVSELLNDMINAEDGDAEGEDFDNDFEEFNDDMDESAKPKFSYDSNGVAESGKVKFEKSASNREQYLKDLTRINGVKAQVLAKLFARKSKDYQFSMKSMRSGRLDTNKLAEAIQRVPTIYERFGEVKTNKINIGVLIDESGSMGGSKIQMARQAAIFINEVFKKQPDVQLYIYGHTADMGSNYGDTQIRTYREPGFQMDPYALGSVVARGNNRDGDAILAVARKIRSKTEDPGMLFVISDGSPNAHHYDGQSAIEDTRKKVTMAQALGFQVIQIAIENHVPSEEMFDYFIKMTNIQNLPNDMIAYVSKKVDKLIKEKISM